MSKRMFSRTKMLAREQTERIAYWISAGTDGADPEILPTRPLDHAMFAANWFRVTKRIDVEPVKALEKLILEFGWIRVQCYEQSRSAAIQGTIAALKERGKKIIEIMPLLQNLTIAYIPADYGEDAPTVSRSRIDSTTWQILINQVTKSLVRKK